MTRHFDASMVQLSSSDFIVMFDKVSKQIRDNEDNADNKAPLGTISIFADFLAIQSMLAIEVDLMFSGVGQGEVRETARESRNGNRSKLHQIEEQIELFYKVFTEVNFETIDKNELLTFVPQLQDELGNTIKPNLLKKQERFGMTVSRKD